MFHMTPRIPSLGKLDSGSAAATSSALNNATPEQPGPPSRRGSRSVTSSTSSGHNSRNSRRKEKNTACFQGNSDSEDIVQEENNAASNPVQRSKSRRRNQLPEQSPDTPSSDKKKRHRRRRKPKLRSKVESVQSSHGGFHDNSPSAGSESGTVSSSNRNRKPKHSNNSTFGWNTKVCPASMGGPTSKKHHDAPMKKRDLYFALHCERVAIGGSNGTEEKASDVVARVTLVNWDYEIVLDTFVHVPVPVSDFYDTGIKPEDLTSNGNGKAEPFASVRQKVESTLKGKILIGHNVDHHLMAMGLTHPWTDIRDSTKFEGFAINSTTVDKTGKDGGSEHTNSTREFSLEELSQMVLKRDLPPKGDLKRPIDNCSAALDLYKNHRKEWEEFLIAQAREKERSQKSQLACVQQPDLPSIDPPIVATLGYNIPSPHVPRGPPNVEAMVVSLHCDTVLTGCDMRTLARVTVVNSFKQVVWDTFVHIPVPVTNFCNTGISAEDVSNVNGAVPFDVVRQQIKELVRDKILVGYGVAESLEALALTHPWTLVRDIAFFRPFMYAEMDGLSRSPVIVERSIDELSLEILQEALAMPGDIDRPVSVCLAALGLYSTFRDHWEQQQALLLQQQEGQGMIPPTPQHHYGQYSQQGSRRNNTSWFSWGKRPGYNTSYYQQRNVTIGPSTTPTAAALSEQAFEALHGESNQLAGYSLQDRSSYYTGSSYMDSSSLYEGSSFFAPSTQSVLDDASSKNPSSKGVMEAFTMDSVASSLYEDTLSIGGDAAGVGDSMLKESTLSQPKNSSSTWFRFGSRKSRYNSPSSQASMLAVQEGVEDPSEEMLPPAAMSIAAEGESATQVADSEEASAIDPPVSRSWFGLRRATSPGRKNKDRSPSPVNLLSGSIGSQPEVDHTRQPKVSADLASDAIEVSLRAHGSDMSESSSAQTPTGTSSERPSGNYSWFGFRRGKSRNSNTEEEPPDREEALSETASDSDEIGLSGTDKTEVAEEDWLQEVMNQSPEAARDEITSPDYITWLNQEQSFIEQKERSTNEKQSESSRGTSWFGFKRKSSISRKTNRLAPLMDTDEEDDNAVPGMAIISQESASISTTHSFRDNSVNDTWAKSSEDKYSSPSPHLGGGWFFSGKNEQSQSSPDEAFFARNRLSTESTIPSVATEEAEEEEGNDSGEEFAEEFEKGIAQSFAYLEI